MPFRLTLAATGLILAAGSASAAERSFPVAGFDRVESRGSVDVRIHTGAAPSARATGDKEILDRLTVAVRDGVLTVGIEPRSGWRWTGGSHGPTTVFVTMPAIRGVALAGSGDVSIDNARAKDFGAALSGSGNLRIATLSAESASLSLRGSGDLDAAGRVGHSALALVGSGNLRAGSLIANDAAIEVTGSGDLDSGATRSATVSLRGSGNVRVTGGARCTIARQGSGDVRCG